MVRKNVSLAQQVVAEIMAGLHDGTLAAADGWLPSETELGQRYNVSRATIREALSKLEHAGVIIRKHGIGTLVAPPAPVIETGLEELGRTFPPEAYQHRPGDDGHDDEGKVGEPRGLIGDGIHPFVNDYLLHPFFDGKHGGGHNDYYRYHQQ